MEYFLEKSKEENSDIDPLYVNPVDGKTAFHRACWGKRKSHTATVELFLKYGIDKNTKSEKGKTCLDYAKEFANSDT